MTRGGNYTLPGMCGYYTPTQSKIIKLTSVKVVFPPLGCDEC